MIAYYIDRCPAAGGAVMACSNVPFRAVESKQNAGHVVPYMSFPNAVYALRRCIENDA